MEIDSRNKDRLLKWTNNCSDDKCKYCIAYIDNNKRTTAREPLPAYEHIDHEKVHTTKWSDEDKQKCDMDTSTYCTYLRYRDKPYKKIEHANIKKTDMDTAQTQIWNDRCSDNCCNYCRNTDRVNAYSVDSHAKEHPNVLKHTELFDRIS
jgi:uncharacterized protein involved in copper resistance